MGCCGLEFGAVHGLLLDIGRFSVSPCSSLPPVGFELLLQVWHPVALRFGFRPRLV